MSRIGRGAALAFAVAMVAQSVTRDAAFARLIGGLALLYVAAELTETISAQAIVVQMAAAAPGAVLVASGVGVPLHQRWAAPLTATVIVIATTTATHTDRSLPRGITWLLVLLTLAGVYACVPETGQIRPLALAAAALGAIEALTRTPLPKGALAAAIGITAWAVAYGGTYRNSALIGGFASLGLLLTFPLAVHLACRLATNRTSGRHAVPAHQAVLVALHAGGALLVSRTAGLASSLSVAVPMAFAMLTVQVGLASLVVPARSRASR